MCAVVDIGRGGGGTLGGTDAPEWMSSAEAAAYLGVNARTLYRLIEEDGLVAYRIGRVIRLQRADVDEYLERCRIHPTPT